jgi:hypothetical protein
MTDPSPLCALSRLEHLSLGNDGLVTDWQLLFDSLGSLKFLELARLRPPFSFADLRSLQNLERLEILALMRPSEIGVQHLPNLSKLSHLKLFFSCCDCRLLTHMPDSLKVLHIVGIYGCLDSLDRFKIFVATTSEEVDQYYATIRHSQID